MNNWNNAPQGQNAPRQQPPPPQAPFAGAQPAPQPTRSLVGSLTEQHLANILIKDAKIAFELNFLKLLARKHANVETAFFVDFLYKAQLYGADPRRDQIYLVTYKKKERGPDGRWGEREVANVVFSYHFYMAKAAASGYLASTPTVHTEVIDYFDVKSGSFIKTIAACARVKRHGATNEAVYWARFPEFAKTRHGENGPILVGQWAEKPYLMLEKCALACVMRLAFPDVLAGMYVQEEITGEESRDGDEGIELEAKEELSIDAPPTGRQLALDSAPESIDVIVQEPRYEPVRQIRNAADIRQAFNDIPPPDSGGR